MADVPKRMKVYPSIDGTESYIRASIITELFSAMRGELIKVIHENRALKQRVGDMVGARAKARQDTDGRVLSMSEGRKTIRRSRDEAPRGKRRHSEDVMDQGGENIISLHDIDDIEDLG